MVYSLEVKNDTVSTIIQSIDLDGIPVDVLKVGVSFSPIKNLLLIIPGNPGIVEYYSTFAKALYQEKNGLYDVWALSHACHSTQDIKHNGLSNHSPLEIEIVQKLKFLEKEVPKDCSITLIGHSIGCFMIQSVLEILTGVKKRISVNDTVCIGFKQSDILSRIQKCYFLFPTIERMKVSPNGVRLWPVLCYLQWFTVGLIKVLNMLPYNILHKLAYYILGSKTTDQAMIRPTLQLINPRMFGNMLSLAYDELSNVKELHTETIDAMKNKIVFYFGVKDAWCPLSYKEDLVKSIPDVNAYVDELGMDHAFVLSHSRAMATFLATKL